MARYTSHRLPYVPALDGVRGYAMACILVYHIRPHRLPGGFSAVDVFFSLSGYLITSIALRGMAAGRFSLKEFYFRRIQRLMPNAIVTIAGVLALWWVFVSPFATVQPAQHALWTLANLANFYSWLHLGGYWGPNAAWAPFTHFWSLGVEEQFYLLFPGLFVLLVKFQPRHFRGWLIGLAVASLVGCVVCTYWSQPAAFYLLPTRAWELLSGAILAIVRAAPGAAAASPGQAVGSRTWEVAGWVGLALTAAGLVSIQDTESFPGYVALVPTVGTLLVVGSVTQGENSVAWLLARPWLVAIGRVSYSLYLWHWPMIILGKIVAERYGYPEIDGALAGGAAGIGMGVAMYFAVERPLRATASDRWGRVAAIGVAFAAVAVASVGVAWRGVSHGLVRQWDRAEFYGELYSVARSDHLDVLESPYLSFKQQPNRPTERWRTGGTIRRYGAVQPQVVVLGSSYALMYAHQIDELCRVRKLSVAFIAADHLPALFESAPGDRPRTPGDRTDFDNARRHWLQQWHPAQVFLIDRWDWTNDSGHQFDERLRAFMREVSPWVGQVVLVTGIPCSSDAARVNLWSLFNSHGAEVRTPPRIRPDGNEALRQQITALAVAATADFPNLKLLRADRLFYEPDGSIRYAAGREFFYANNSHLNEAGAAQVRPLFAAALAAAPPARPAAAGAHSPAH